MPITTSLDRHNYVDTAEAILREWLLDYFPSASYVVTYESPGRPTKPILWLQKLPSDNRLIRERSGGRTVQGKAMAYAVSALADDRKETLRMVGRLEAAVLASASTLGTAGLRYVEAVPFQEHVVESDVQTYRRTGAISFTVTI